MERRVFIGEGVGYLLIALGIGAFESVIDPNSALATLLVRPFAFLGGALTSLLLKNEPGPRTARGALGLFVLWALLHGLAMLVLPQFVSPTSWQDWLMLPCINALVISGSALCIAWRLQRQTTPR